MSYMHNAIFAFPWADPGFFKGKGVPGGGEGGEFGILGLWNQRMPPKM